MKIDEKLIELLLIEAEGDEPRPDFNQYTEEQILYHKEYLVVDKLAKGLVLKGDDITYKVYIYDLEPKGHQKLKELRDSYIIKFAKNDGVNFAQITVNVSELAKWLATHFNEGELNRLCQELNIDHEDFPREKGIKTLEIVRHFNRTGNTVKLIKLAVGKRPLVANDFIQTCLQNG